MTTHIIRKHISFKCCKCNKTANIIERDGRIESITCPSCGVFVSGNDATLMRADLNEGLRFQEGKNFSRRLVNKLGMGRVPLGKVDKEFSHPDWPFILVSIDDA